MTAQPARRFERSLLAFVRDAGRIHGKRRRSDRWLDLYTALIFVGYGVLAVVGTVDASVVARPDTFATAANWAPVLLLVLSWGVLRFATWQGPVLFPSPTLHWVFGAPIRRDRLVRGRLLRAFVFAIAIGIIAGLAGAIAAEALLGRGFLAVFASTTGGMSAFTLLATALAWQVERNPAATKAVGRSGLAILVLGGAAGAAVAAGWETAVLWSGPWGWAVAPIQAAAEMPTDAWVVPLLLLLVATTAALIAAMTTAAGITDEVLWDRARTHSSTSAALFLGDVRTLSRVARRQRQQGNARIRASRMPHVRRPWLAIPARGMVTLRRNFSAFGATSLLFATLGFAAAVAAIERPVFVLGAFVAFYLAASRLLEPLRIEADVPDAHLMMPQPWGVVAVLHCVVPTVTLTVVGWIGLGVVTAGGWVALEESASLALMLPFGVATLVTANAISALRGPFPIERLLGGSETGALGIVGWIIVGPTVAAIALEIAAGARSTFGTIGTLTFVTLATSAYLWTRQPPT